MFLFSCVSLILGLQSISRDAEDNGSHPRRLDPTMKLITYSFVFTSNMAAVTLDANHQ